MAYRFPLLFFISPCKTKGGGGTPSHSRGLGMFVLLKTFYPLRFQSVLSWLPRIEHLTNNIKINYILSKCQAPHNKGSYAAVAPRIAAVQFGLHLLSTIHVATQGNNQCPASIYDERRVYHRGTVPMAFLQD